MPKRYEFELPFQQDLEKFVRRRYPEIQEYRLISKSLDARGAPRGRTPIYNYIIEGLIGPQDKWPELASFPQFSPLKLPPIIVGAGPAGLFCAVYLAEHGIPSIIVERGADASKRMLYISKFWRYGEFDSETNVCYGEGGAGLFSDGKLITRIKSHHIPYVMNKLVEFGAPADTAYISNPHLGSNKIRGIITKVSEWLLARGCQIHYNTRVASLITENKRVVGVKLHDGQELRSNHVVLAAGHSAKEMYQHLMELAVAMKPKDFAVGVRIEHTRRHIDRIQHGQFCEAPELGSARYRLSWHDHTVDRGVYSFCMCPGGYVLSSGTEADGIVVNGMSNFARNSPWSNAALVVTVKSSQDLNKTHLLAGLEFQHEIERKAYELSRKQASGRELPAMSVREFMQGKLDDIPLPPTSSPSRLFKADLQLIFPAFIVENLKKGLAEFDKKLPGFVTGDAILIAPETRTSSPLTILRDKQTLISTSHAGLYPCGEGAGHAGGITSAAVDGVKVAYSILEQEKLLRTQRPEL